MRVCGAAEGWTHDAVVLLARIAGVTSRIGLATAVLPVWSRTPAGGTSGPSGLGLRRNSASRSSLQRSPRPRSASQVSSRTTGCRSSGHARCSPLAGRCWPRARQPASARPRPALPPAYPLAIAQNEEAARQIAAGWLLAYLTRMGPLYPRMLRDYFGFAREVDAILEANVSGQPPRLPAAAERLAHEVTVVGTYEDAPDVVRLWLEGGADTVDLVLPLGLPVEQLSEMLEAAARS